MAKRSILLLALAAIAQAQNTDTKTTANANTDTNTAAATNTQGTQAAGTTSLTDLPNLSDAPSVGASSITVTNAPDISSSIFHLSGVPTIAGYGVPTQIVPWTAGAPYMQTSKLPEGTVFIIVGAFLGTLGAAILLWRGLIAWSLHRSVRKAQLGTPHSDSMLKLSKPSLANPPTMTGSTLSLDRLSAPAGKLSKHAQHNSGSGSVSNARTSLFFSPTAGAGAHHSSPTAAMTAGTNRSSAYLPAGYYAAPGAAAPTQTSVGSGAAAALSSLNPMHPSNKGYRPQYDVSPPDSPSLPPSRNGGRGYAPMSDYGADRSGLTLPGGAPAGQRAPSANLEDLFEHHGNGMRGDQRY